jgi:hypothetical protein
MLYCSPHLNGPKGDDNTHHGVALGLGLQDCLALSDDLPDSTMAPLLARQLASDQQ